MDIWQSIDVNLGIQRFRTRSSRRAPQIPFSEVLATPKYVIRANTFIEILVVVRIQQTLEVVPH